MWLHFNLPLDIPLVGSTDDIISVVLVISFIGNVNSMLAVVTIRYYRQQSILS